MAVPFEENLLNAVGRIDDPKVVASLVSERLAGKIRTCEGRGTYIWDGRKWEEVDEKDLYGWSYKTYRAVVAPEINGLVGDLHRLAQEHPDKPELSGAAQVLNNLLSKSRWVRKVCGYLFPLAVWRSEEGDISINTEVLRKTIGFLSVANGVIDLKSGVLYNHSDKKDLFFTYSLQTSYNPNAQAPNFFRALEIWAHRNPELIEYLQFALGSALTGQKVYDNVFWLHGSPYTRKELLLQIVADILEDYAMAIPHPVFKDDNRNEKLLAQLGGKRMVYCVDYPDGAPMCKAALVHFCEYEQIPLFYSVRIGFRMAIIDSVYSLTNLFIASSGYPNILYAKASVMARLRPIILRTHSQYHRLFDSTFIRKIMQEKEGILAWLVEGARKYLADLSLKNNPALQNFAMNMKEQWIEDMKKAQNKKPLPIRKGQTQNKNRRRYDDAE